MIRTHQFVIGPACYWHHEWERCAHCGRLDKPDDPDLPFHLHHDEELEALRQRLHPEHDAMVAMGEGRPVRYDLKVGWVVK